MTIITTGIIIAITISFVVFIMFILSIYCSTMTSGRCWNIKKPKVQGQDTKSKAPKTKRMMAFPRLTVDGNWKPAAADEKAINLPLA